MDSDERTMLTYLNSCSIPEKNLVEGILGSSTEFKKFYDAERKKIKSPIIWIYNKKLRVEDQIPKGRLGEIRTLPNGHISIIIHNYPAKNTDATTIAHELAHEIVGKEGFPLIGHYIGCDDPQIISLARILNEMIHDPLVIIKLLEYGFDLQGEYKNDCIDGLKKMTKNGSYSGIRSIMLVFIYVKNLIENDILFSSPDNPCSEFIEKLEEYHPEYKAKGKELYEFIQLNGFQSPDQVKRIYERVYGIYPDLRELTVIYE